MSKMQFDIGFKLDKTGIAQAKQELSILGKDIDKKFANKELSLDKSSYEEVKKEIDVIGKALDRAFNADLNKLNLKTFSRELQKSGVDIRSTAQKFGAMGEEGVQAFLNIQRSMMNTGVQVKKTNGLVQEMADTFAKTVKWNIASSAVNSFSGSVQRAIGFVKNLDDSLNQVRIVTGKSSKEMEVFAEQANESAQALGKTTREYTDASLLFFQQGKSAAEVRQLTEATLMGANITGTEVSAMADMITSALNGYSWAADKAIKVTDTLAAVGAATGADFEELAIGMSKVASQAATVGVPFETLNAMLATISETTREAPETIGTSLKTVFARMSEIKLEGSATDEDGVTMSLGKVQDALSLIDVSLLDTEGAMKDMGDVIIEIGNKWEGLDVATKSAITNAMAGQRQASRLMALFNQWERFEVSLDAAQNATGATMEQNIIRTDSLAYKSKQLTAELEEMYMKLISPEFMKNMTEGLTSIVSTVNEMIDGLGGIDNILLILGGTAFQVFSKQMAEPLIKVFDTVVDLGAKIKTTTSSIKDSVLVKLGKKEAPTPAQAGVDQQVEDAGVELARKSGSAEQLKYAQAMVETRKQEEKIARTLSAEDLKSFQANKEALLLEHEKLIALKRQREERLKMAEKDILTKGSYSVEDILGDTANVQSMVTKEIEDGTKAVNEQKEILKAITIIRQKDYSLAELEDIATTNKTRSLTDQQKLLRKMVQENKINLDSMVVGEGLAKGLEETEREVNSALKDRQHLLDEAIKDQQNILTIVEAQQASYEEENAQIEIDRLDAQNARLEDQANKQQVVQASLSAIGTTMQFIGALSTFKQLGDDTLSAGEKLNVVKTGLVAITGVLLGAIPVVAGLSTAFTTMGWTAAAAWATALAPALPVIAAIAAVGAGITWLVKEFKPLNRAIEKNAEVLEKQNAALEESKNRVKDLRGAVSALEELKEIQMAGIDEGDTEAMAKYVDLSNQIASVAPELVRYYDEQGNAIIDLNANLDGLIDNELELQKVAQEAKEANRDNFITEYKNIVDTETERIEAKTAILEEIKKNGEYIDQYSGVSYDSSDITSLTAEITNSQQKIKETQGLIQQNIVDPIFGASEAYGELNAANQNFVRGLLNAEVIAKKMNDEVAMEGYISTVERYLDVLANKAAPIQEEITSIKERMAVLASDGITAEEREEYQSLNDTLEETKKKLDAVSGSFGKLLEANQGAILEISTLFDVQGEQLDELMTKLSDYYSESSNLAQGPMAYADVAGMAGQTVATGNEEAYSTGRETSINIDLIALTGERIKYEEARQQLIASMQTDEYGATTGTQEQIDKLNEYNQVLYENGKITEDLEYQRAQIKSQTIFDVMEEKQIQEELNAIYWEQIDALLETTEGYNQVAQAYRDTKEASGDASATMAQVNSLLSEDMSWEQIRTSLSEYVDEIPGLGDALAQSAETGQEALDGVLDKYNELADQQGKLYAKLKGNDKKYFNQFKTDNKNQTKLIEVEYGIRADDFATYNEYEEALAKAQKGKKKNILDQETRDKLLAGDQQTQIAWGVADEEVGASAESGRAQIQNNATTAEVVANNMQIMKNAGVSAWDRIRYFAAVIGDKIVSIWNTARNNVVEVWNGVLSWLSGKVSAIGNKLPDIFKKTKSMFSNFADFLISKQGEMKDENYTGLQDKFTESMKDEYGDGGYDFDYGSGDITDKVGGGGGITDTAGSGGPDLSGGGDKGSGGKGDSGSDKEVEDLEWEEDIYHDINIELEKKQQLLDDLKKQQDKLYGKELLENLAKQKQALQDQQKLLEKKLEMQKQDMKNQQALLGKEGVKFNVDGTIANYNELLKQKLAYVNSLSGEAKEAAKEEFSSLVDMMEKYEDLIMNAINDTEDAIQESIDAQREIWMQEFEYAIQLKIEISEDLQKALDYMKDINNEFEDYSENYERTQAQIEEQLELVERLKIKLEEINNDPDLTEKERLELLEKYNEELMNAVKELDGLEEQLTKIFEDTLKDGLDMVKDHVNEFKNLNDQLKHYEQTLKLIGEGDNFAVLDSIYEAQYGNLMGQIDVLNKTMDTLKVQQAALQAAGMVGTDEWKALSEAIQNTQKDINSLAQESLKLLQQEFQNSVEEIMSSLENAMTGGAGFSELKKQQQELKEERKKYLDGEEKLLSISKLQQKVQKEIDETSDPAKKAELQKFMDTELAKLKEKDKLTKYDVDRANLIYDITLKQMALDDQRATKNIMRLVRDTQGNWVYEFTEDAKAIEKAQEDVSSAMEKLMELDKKKLEETQDLMMKLQEEYYKEVQEIAKDAANGKYKTEEELRQALQSVSDKYNQKMVEANDLYEEVKLNATISSMGAILDAYNKNGIAAENLTKEQQALLESLAKNTSGSFLDMADTVEALLTGKGIEGNESVQSILDKLGTETGLTVDEMSSALTGMAENMQSNWGLAVTDMIGDFIGEGGLQEASNNAIGSIIDKWNEYQGKIDEVQKETGLDLGSIQTGIEDIDTATGELNKETDALIDKFEEELAAVGDLTIAYQKNREEIRNTIKDMLDYIDTINKAIAAIKEKNDTESNKNPGSGGSTGGGSSSGSGSGGSSGSTTTTPPAPNWGGSDLKAGMKVRVKSGTRGYYDSFGMSPSTANLDSSKSYLVDDYGIYRDRSHGIHLSNSSGGDLGWVPIGNVAKFDTGGYTGAWGSEGKMAMLHEKEMVLNKQDTGNILQAIEMLRDSNLASILRRFTPSASSYSNNNYNETSTSQNITIHADFSGVSSSNEIEKAFENMANMASQYAHR